MTVFYMLDTSKEGWYICFLERSKETDMFVCEKHVSLYHDILYQPRRKLYLLTKTFLCSEFIPVIIFSDAGRSNKFLKFSSFAVTSSSASFPAPLAEMEPNMDIVPGCCSRALRMAERSRASLSVSL